MDKSKEANKQPEGGILVDAAKAIGRTAGKVASLVGAAQPQTAAKPKIGKLAKSGKSRLPRREKKAAAKAAAPKVAAASKKSPAKRSSKA